MALSADLLKIKAFIQADIGTFLTLRKRLLKLQENPVVGPTAQQMLVELNSLEPQVNDALSRLQTEQVGIRDLPSLITIYAQMRKMILDTEELERKAAAGSTTQPTPTMPDISKIFQTGEIPWWVWGIGIYFVMKKPSIILIPLLVSLLRQKLMEQKNTLGLELTPLIPTG